MKKQKLIPFLWPVLLMIVIFVFSAFPAEASDQQSGIIVDAVRAVFPETTDIKLITTIVRKTAHFLEYALLGFLFARALFVNIGNKEKLDKRAFLYGIGLAAIVSMGDETHQAFVPGRSCQITDILLDSFGATVGARIYYLICKNRLKKAKKQ
jgi:VanZ family protein